ncbi:hypothetical protein ACE6H2_000291 [Prunus campanulata]
MKIMFLSLGNELHQLGNKTWRLADFSEQVNLQGPQNIKLAEKSLAVKEPTANFALCVSSLKIAQVLNQTETIAELLNVC